ncbi:MAG TPA: threonine dehydratase [Hyphomicrobiaceae bacterium]|nr:threonine dehydratase [Hyphomicrobiaceae bacterium]
MPLFTLAELEAALPLVRSVVPATPQHAWPLLARRTGAQVWVKHENHTPIGAFKIRGGVIYLDALKRSGRQFSGVVTATRGNHGQSIALAAARAGLPCTIFVPHGNSREKNAAMQALGAELIVIGSDFDACRPHAAEFADRHGYHYVPSFHADLVKGVATYALELFAAVKDLDAVYAPIGMGSGICGLISVRDLLGLRTDIIGVVADSAPAVALSFDQGRLVNTNAAATFADGMACRVPVAEPVDIIRRGAARLVRVTEDEIADAIRAYYTDTHNLAEGAGAAPLAALLKERTSMQGKRIGLILSGGNIDREPFADVLAGNTPRP